MAVEEKFQQCVHRIEGLVSRLATMDDPDARACAEDLVKALMDLHGAGIDRMMEIAWESGEQGRQIIEGFARDHLVASLLLLYGLHPLDLKTRVTEALDRVRPYLDRHGGSVALLDISDGVVRLRLEASNNGCGSAAQSARAAIEQAVYEAAPDASAVVIEDAPAFVPLASLRNKKAQATQ
jgi:Fe-S cluster biogenesis protein NfuA